MALGESGFGGGSCMVYGDLDRMFKDTLLFVRSIGHGAGSTLRNCPSHQIPRVSMSLNRDYLT